MRKCLEIEIFIINIYNSQCRFLLLFKRIGIGIGIGIQKELVLVLVLVFMYQKELVFIGIGINIGIPGACVASGNDASQDWRFGRTIGANMYNGTIVVVLVSHLDGGYS